MVDREPPEDTTMPDATVTQLHPRRADPTRLDVRGRFDVAEPTAIATPYRDAAGRPITVSPIGAHTQGAPAAVDRLNAALDERDRRAVDRATRTGIFRRRTRKALTVRQHADRRAMRRMRHERHMETLEAVRAYLATLCLIALFLLVLGMAVVAFAILAGWMTWVPARV